MLGTKIFKSLTLHLRLRFLSRLTRKLSNRCSRKLSQCQKDEVASLTGALYCDLMRHTNYYRKLPVSFSDRSKCYVIKACSYTWVIRCKKYKVTSKRYNVLSYTHDNFRCLDPPRQCTLGNGGGLMKFPKIPKPTAPTHYVFRKRWKCIPKTFIICELSCFCTNYEMGFDRALMWPLWTLIRCSTSKCPPKRKKDFSGNCAVAYKIYQVQ